MNSSMPEKPILGASRWPRSLLGIGSVAFSALVVVLAAVLGLVEPDLALESCVALAALALASFGLARSRYRSRLSEEVFVCAQVAASFVLLAWLTYRADDNPAVIPMLYLVAMLYGMLQLDRTRLAILAMVAAVTHGTALFMLIDKIGRASCRERV